MTITLPSGLTAQDSFEILEDIRLLSQSGFKRFVVVDTKDGPRMKTKKDGVIDTKLPDCMKNVTGMFTYKDGKSAVRLKDGEEKDLAQWLLEIAGRPDAKSELKQMLDDVMAPPLSNYYIHAERPRYPDLMAQIDTDQRALSEKSREVKDMASEAQGTRGLLLGDPEEAVNIRDITALAAVSQEDLKRLYDANLGPFDLETTGLNPEKNAISEISALKVIVGRDKQYHVLHFHAFLTPERPEYRKYLAARNTDEPLPYDRRKYEYDVSLDALGVTGTDYLRPDPRGPITEMRVGGKKVPAVPFYEAVQAYNTFCEGVDQTAFNAFFDKPFQHAKRQEAKDTGESRDSSINPAHFICQMLLTMRHRGQGPVNNLENAYRFVDPTFGERGDHLAFEDNVMLLRITADLLRHYGTAMSVNDIYRDVIHGADPKAEVNAGPKGSVVIRFSMPPEQMDAKTKQLWEFFHDMNEAKLRNPRIPEAILSCVENGKERVPVKTESRKKSAKLDEDGEPVESAEFENAALFSKIASDPASVVLSSKGAKPAILSLLKKIMIYDDLLKNGVLDKLSFYDSSSKVDVTLPPSAQSNGPTEEDVPLGALRLNYPYLMTHLDRLQDNVTFLKSVSGMKNVGLIILSDDQVEIRPFQRQFGKVNFVIPKGTKPTDHKEKITESIRFLSSIGGIPGVVNATEHWQDEADEDIDHAPGRKKPVGVIQSSVNLQRPDHIRMEISAALAQCLLHANEGSWPDGIRTTPTPEGNTVLEGSKGEFQQFQHTIKDMSWLLHRISRLPGTHDFELKEDGTAVLHQDWGASTDAIQILEGAQIAFTATKKEITFDINPLMKEAYRYSSSIENIAQELARNADRVEKNRDPVPAHIGEMQRRLFDDTITQAHIDKSGRSWVTLPDGNRHEITVRDTPMVLEYGTDGALRTPISSIAGEQHLRFIKLPEDKVMLVAHAQMLSALWDKLGDTEKAECKFSPTSIIMPEKISEAHREELIRHGEAVYRMRHVHGDPYVPMQVTAPVENGDLHLRYPELPALADLVYSKQLDALRAECTTLSEKTAVASLGFLPEELTSARHGDPAALLAHLAKRLDDIQTASNTQLEIYEHYQNRELIGDMKGHHRAYDGATRQLQDILAQAGPQAAQNTRRAAHVSDTLARTLSTAHYHLKEMEPVWKIIGAGTEDEKVIVITPLNKAITSLQDAMCDLYLVLSKKTPEYRTKAEEMFEQANPGEIAGMGNGKQNARWKKKIEKIEAQENNPYLLLQSHKALIGAAQRVKDALDEIRRHSNQAGGSVETLSNMLSAAPARGSFVRDVLKGSSSPDQLLHDAHIRTSLAALGSGTSAFALKGRELLIPREALMGEPFATPANDSFTRELANYALNPEVAIRMTPQNADITLDTGTGTGETQTFTVPRNQSLPRSLRAIQKQKMLVAMDGR